MVVAERIELSSSAYKTDALTVELCDIILVAGRGIEPRSLAYETNQFTRTVTRIILVVRVGLEPTVSPISAGCFNQLSYLTLFCGGAGGS